MLRCAHSADSLKTRRVQYLRAALRSATILALACLPAIFARAQATTAALPDQDQPSAAEFGSASPDTPDANSAFDASRNSSLLSGDQSQRSALCSDQIVSVLEQSPDIVTELKLQLAQQIRRRGFNIDPVDISDQMLYRQVASDASLRNNLVAMLQARGVETDEDLQQPASADGTLLAADDRAGASMLTACAAQPSSQLPQSSASNTLPPTAPYGLSRPVSLTTPRSAEKASLSTDPPLARHQPAPFDLESMRDLYAQIPGETARLERFGSDVFLNRAISSAARGIPLDVPIGPDYILGRGDTLTITLWGGATERFTRSVDRDGRIFLPEAGALQIAGLSLGDVQKIVGDVLRQQFRNAQVAVTVSGLRSVRVYVVGDVQRPGGYDISSLATPLSALYAAGGPTAIGSLRVLRHYRGKQLIGEFDLYDFLLHGVRNESAGFESGDTLLVPPSGPQVAISGAVKRPAIYELKSGETTLGVVINDAGGLAAAASLDNIRIERIDAHLQRVTVPLPNDAIEDPPGDPNIASSFEVKDGDRIRVESILPYSQRAVYLAGHVVRPGRIAFSDGMRLSDVLHSYQDMLPEPAARGEIVRLVPPDLHAETIDFNVPDVLIGNANIPLQPFDTIRIFGRYQVDAPTVTIRGEVLHPGTYPMSAGMTAAQLVRIAGGFKRDALLDSADLTSYGVKAGNQVEEQLATVRIGDAVQGADPTADVPLKPGDTLGIHQITNWDDIGQSVTIQGQVRFPGSYGFHEGERLSSVLRRAGGLLPTAYPAGAVLVRAQVRDLEQSSRDQLVRQIEANSAAARVSPAAAGANGQSALQLIRDQEDQVVRSLQDHPPEGRMVIHISADIDSWANSPADIELRRDDVLTIPKRPGFVLVTGQVYNATALTFVPGKTAGWYLDRAGGANASANQKDIFVIRANGSVVGRRSGDWFAGSVLSTKLDPGDVVVVPQKIVGGSLLWRNLLSAGQIAASAAVTAGIAAATL